MLELKNTFIKETTFSVNMYKERFEKVKEFDGIFSLIKDVVAKRFGLHRAGLSLVLADLPPTILALHEMGSNSIFVNRKILETMALETDNRINRNSYIFVVLLHEYLHSFGFSDEKIVREMVLDIVKFAFGSDHPAYLAAVDPLSLVGDKDRESMSFIS